MPDDVVPSSVDERLCNQLHISMVAPEARALVDAELRMRLDNAVAAAQQVEDSTLVRQEAGLSDRERVPGTRGTKSQQARHPQE
jgi:hypothetical protein